MTETLNTAIAGFCGIGRAAVRTGPGRRSLLSHVSKFISCLQMESLQHIYKEYELDASGEYVVPGLEGDQRILDAGLVVLGHVLVHVWVVLPDVALGAAVRDRPEAEGRGIRVGTLELQSQAQEKGTDGF